MERCGNIPLHLRRHRRIHAAHRADDEFIHLTVGHIERAHIVRRLIEHIQRLGEVRVTVGRKHHETVAVELRHRTVGSALHTDACPEIVVAEQCFEHAHRPRVAIAQLEEIRPLCHVLHAALRRQSLVACADVPRVRRRREHCRRERVPERGELLCRLIIYGGGCRHTEDQIIAVKDLRQDACKCRLHLRMIRVKVLLECREKIVERQSADLRIGARRCQVGSNA